MCLLDFIDHGTELAPSCLIYGILFINTDNRLIRRNLNNIHSVNFSELVLFGKRCTRHTCFLIVFVEEVLECDSRERAAFSLNFNMLLGFYRLMESI